MDKKHIKELKKYLKKCLRSQEAPFKLEYANAVILKTYDLQSSESVWTYAKPQTLKLYRFTTWKFCCLIHKILNEGHPNSLRDGIKYMLLLKHCAKYWTMQSDIMGPCNAWYFKVLHTKLLFHQTYTNFTGNLKFYDETLRDINICFQLCLDLFDYLEDLVHLQRVIFANMQQHQISASSKKGMCRLASLVTIIAECNLLYEHSITILRLLHLQLSPDDISGLCDRFNKIFKELKLFYEHVHIQQFPGDFYLAIPELPSMPPNLYITATNQQEPSAPPL